MWASLRGISGLNDSWNEACGSLELCWCSWTQRLSASLLMPVSQPVTSLLPTLKRILALPPLPLHSLNTFFFRKYHHQMLNCCLWVELVDDFKHFPFIFCLSYSEIAGIAYFPPFFCICTCSSWGSIISSRLTPSLLSPNYVLPDFVKSYTQCWWNQ